MIIEEMKYNSGDFRSQYCTRLLQESDIVVTNPPFSLFREFFAWLMKADKKFIIIGNMGSLIYKEVFPYFKDGKLNIGFNTSGGSRRGNSMSFIIPDDTSFKDVTTWWFTNFEIVNTSVHDASYYLTKTQNEELGAEYIKYDNYDAIDVSKEKQIPIDYDGVMGVPVSAFRYIDTSLFEVIGLGVTDLGKSIGVGDYDRKYKTPASRDGTLYYIKDGKGVVPYSRILIRRKVVN